MEDQEQQKLERLQVPEIGDLLDGRYRIQGVIATGGMGVILRAEQLPMQRPVAIKLLHPHIAEGDPGIVGRFEREVRLAKQLNHPNTIRLYDFGESEQGLVYVAMELLDGMDLKRLIARRGGLSVGRALEICRQMLDGLAEAHAHDFIHRDLKPSNVFIIENRRGEDVVKLLDFGIAKSLTDAADLTGPGAICGTPAYVAPEYLLQEAAGKPSDVYAVGLILLEMLDGRQVFKGEAPVQTMMMHLKIDPELPEDLQGSALAEVIERATAKDPRERFQDAEAMFKAICKVDRDISPKLRSRRPDLLAFPDVADDGGHGKASEERRRAESDTIVPQTTRRPACCPPDGCPPVSGRPRRRAFSVALGLVVFGVSMVGVGLFWALDPGSAPELQSPEVRASPQDSLASKADPLASKDDWASKREAKATSAQKRSADAGSEATTSVGWNFDLDTDPSGAAVIVGERQVGRTPLSHRLAPEALPTTVRFELDGYEAVEVELHRASSPIVVEVLEERERRAAPEPSHTRRDKTRRDKTRRDKTRRDKTRHDKTRHDKTKRTKTRRTEIRRGTKRSTKAQVHRAEPAEEPSSGLSNKRVEEVVDQFFPE